MVGQKILTILLFLSFSGAGLYLLFQPKESSVNISEYPVSSEMSRSSQDVRVKSLQRSVQSQKENASPMSTLAELESARDLTGLIDLRDRSLYSYYDTHTLEVMGQQGDLAALETLADHYYEQGDVDGAHQALRLGTIYGSTQMLLLKAGSLQGLAEAQSVLGNTDKAEKLWGTSLAWLRFGVLRGEPIARQEYERVLRSLPEIDENVIKVQARAIYEELIEERRSLGFGDFDDSHRKTLERVYSDWDGHRERDHR